MLPKLSLSEGGAQVIVYSAGKVAVKAIGFFMLPYVTHKLSVEAYGQWEYMAQISMVLGFLFYGPWFNSCLRFAASDATLASKAQWFVSALAWTGVQSCALLPLFYLALFYGVMSDFSAYHIVLLLCSVFFNSVYLYATAWLRILNRSQLYSVLHMVYVLIMVFVCVVLLQWGWGLEGMLWGALAPSFLLSCPLLIMHRRSLLGRPDVSQIKRLVVMGASLIPDSVSAFIIQGLDVMLLIHLVGFEIGAYYAVVLKFSGILLVVVMGLDMWWGIKRFELFESGTLSQHREIALTLGTVLFLLAQVVAACSPWLVDGLLPSAYHGAGTWVFYLVNIYAIRFFFEFLSTGFLKRDHLGHATWISAIMGASALAAYYLLVPTYHIMGCLLVVGVGFLARTIMRVVISQRQMHQAIPWPAIWGLMSLAWVMHWLGGQVEGMGLQVVVALIGSLLMLWWSFKTSLLLPLSHLVQWR